MGILLHKVAVYGVRESQLRLHFVSIRTSSPIETSKKTEDGAAVDIDSSLPAV